MSFKHYQCSHCKKNPSIAKILIRSPRGFQSVYSCAKCYDHYNIFLHEENSGAIGNIFKEMFFQDNDSKQNSLSHDRESQRMVCSSCLTSFEEVLTSGRFGCLQCVDYFESLLDNFFSSSQNYSFHRGMTPSFQEGKYKQYQNLYFLKALLKESVESEDFLRARKIKKHILQLEKQLQNTGNADTR